MEKVLIYINQNFSYEIYILSTKIQGLIWTIADIILVFCVLKIINIARSSLNKEPTIFRYALLIISIALVPLLILTRSSDEFFRVESFLCGIQFLILIYTVLYDRKSFIRYLEIKGILREDKKL